MLKIIAIGKIKEPFYRQGIDEYSKRISKFAKLSIDEIKDSDKEKEGKKILQIADEIIKKANLVLSLSQMTFLHEMIRLILVEQIYRAVTINRGMKYHK